MPVKTRLRSQITRLEDLPNVGPSIAEDLHLIGIHEPGDLMLEDGLQMYARLEQVTGQRHDPCVADVFLSIVDFMQGAPAQPWWAYTAARKERLGR
jgi:hypothetical protein